MAISRTRVCTNAWSSSSSSLVPFFFIAFSTLSNTTNMISCRSSSEISSKGSHSHSSLLMASLRAWPMTESNSNLLSCEAARAAVVLLILRANGLLSVVAIRRFAAVNLLSQLEQLFQGGHVIF